MIDVDHIYICHWNKLKEIKKYVIEHLEQLGLNEYHFVECFDKETWDIDQVQKEYPKIFGSSSRNTKLNLSEISLTLKYCWAIKDAYEQGYESVLMLEDDVELHPDFINLFNNFKGQLPKNWDLAWVGSCCDLHAKAVPHQNVYRVNGSRCTHAFMISRNCINKLIHNIHDANDAADHYFNYLIETFQLNNYWFEPSLAEQNKNSEIFNTTIHTEEYLIKKYGE